MLHVWRFDLYSFYKQCLLSIGFISSLWGAALKLPSSNDFDVSYEIEFGDRIRNASSNSDAFLELIKSDSITFETYITLDGEVTYSSLSTSAGGHPTELMLMKMAVRCLSYIPTKRHIY